MTTILCNSGCATAIPDDDPVYIPTGNYRDGDVIDPETVEFETALAGDACQPGSRIIINNRVEVIRSVGPGAPKTGFYVDPSAPGTGATPTTMPTTNATRSARRYGCRTTRSSSPTRTSAAGRTRLSPSDRFRGPQ